jgi:hypothetical protein
VAAAMTFLKICEGLQRNGGAINENVEDTTGNFLTETKNTRKHNKKEHF